MGRMRGYMKREPHFNQEKQNNSSHTIPDIQIIDLDNNEKTDLNTETLMESDMKSHMESDIESDMESDEEAPAGQEPRRKGFHIGAHTAMHLALLAVVVIVVIVVIDRVGKMGQFISQEEIFKDGEGIYDNTYDQFLPALDADGNLIVTETGKDMTILMLGNSPLSDDKDSEDGLANMIAERTGANVINCAISGSYMAAQQPNFYATKQSYMDAYTPYWLCVLACIEDIDPYQETAAEALGENTPLEAEEVYEILSALDMNTVDVVAFMYDGTDYLMGHEIYSAENSADIQQFSGNLEASIDLIQYYFPHIRIIVMSPAYAFGVNENGEYISSDIQTYGQDFLSTYFYMEMLSCVDKGVTFVDNLYGTINEDIASEYLSDNIHLNVKGRKLMADRFIYALTYFDS